MSELKCPFCQQELDKFGYYFGATPIFLCNNCHLFGGLKLWQELIRTRKALDVAVDALKDCEKILKADRKDWEYLTADIALKQIEQITALEQKDVK